MKNEIRMSNFNGKTGYEIIAYPENTEEAIPDISNVGKEFYELNYKGLFCYGLKVIVKLIKHFNYDYSEWYDLLVGMTDYTLIDYSLSTEGRRSKYWYPSEYSPGEMLEPIFMPDENGKEFYPCDICGRSRWLFAEYGAESGFCLNYKNCSYAANNYRYNRPDKNKYSVGWYKECYDLFMTADINLLRVIYDTLSLTNEIPGELFNGDRIPLIADMLNVCEDIGAEPPDLSGIPKEGFGKECDCSFDCIGLINGKDQGF